VRTIGLTDDQAAQYDRDVRALMARWHEQEGIVVVRALHEAFMAGGPAA
jgi:hypothetical protein